jgi:hypothetical protein
LGTPPKRDEFNLAAIATITSTKGAPGAPIGTVRGDTAYFQDNF